MNNRYPKLSLAQQQNLPELIQARPLPKMFADSTHQLWHCDTVEGEFMLKVCDGNAVANSTFWQGMTLLFDVQLPAQLGEFKRVYDLVSQNSLLTIPDYIASDYENSNKQQRAFILTKMMPGSMVEQQDVTDDMVRQLAQHIAMLHQHDQARWGQIHDPGLNSQQWSSRLQDSLKILGKDNRTVPLELLDEAVDAAGQIRAERFAPVMIDLRWDQFLQQDGKLTALVDLDAFVYAPRELELVLLEYLLSDEQAKLFAEYYQQIQPLPDLAHVRRPYRLLLFMMNVLGEDDINAWMASKVIFQYKSVKKLFRFQ